MTDRRDWWPYLLVAPAVLVELAVHLLPAALGIWSAFRELSFRTIADPAAAPFVGWQNMAAVASSEGSWGGQLWTSLGRSVVFTLLVVGISAVLGISAALLFGPRFRGRGALRVLFLVPFALPVYAAVLGWRQIFARDTGLLNHVLVDQIGVLEERPFWLIGDNAMVSLVIVAVWRLWPFVFLMVSAALHGVDDRMYEAAALDGAGWWQQHWQVTRPAIGRIIGLVLAIALVWTFNDFGTPHLLFDGNPPESALLYPNLVYRNAFGVFELGLAGAANTIVIVVLAGVAGLFRGIRVLGRRGGRP